jgi:hypothetical protein
MVLLNFLISITLLCLFDLVSLRCSFSGRGLGYCEYKLIHAAYLNFRQ